MVLPVYSVYIAVLSIVAYFFYAADKIKAKKGKWRIPEATLLGLSLFGGALGGYLAMHTLRHKTKHWYFYAVNILGGLWQLSLLVYLLVTEL